MGKRTAEFVLGLIGGIFGILGALFVLGLGGLVAAFGAERGSTVFLMFFFASIFSVLGIVGAALVKTKTKLGGWLMIISAIGGLISISFAYTLSFVLLIIAGLMALIKKEKEGRK